MSDTPIKEGNEFQRVGLGHESASTDKDGENRPGGCGELNEVTQSNPVQDQQDEVPGMNKSENMEDLQGVDDGYDDFDDYETDDDDIEAAHMFMSQLQMNASMPMNTIDDVVSRILDGRCKQVVVLSGAGVSVAAGIPDFRSPGTGLYDNLQKYNLPFPEAVFDLDFYRYNPQPFVSLAKELWPGNSVYYPTLSHYFIRLLEDKNILLRNYTQNIDGLEILAGVPPEKMVECHGQFRNAACIQCKSPYDGDLCKKKIVGEGLVPTCDACGGLVKPKIVFFGESLPERFGQTIQQDLFSADLLIVMGTSLKVAPVSLIPELMDVTCPRVLFNRDLVGNFLYARRPLDVWEGGDCDISISNFCTKLGWAHDLNKLHEKGKVDHS